MLEYKWAKTEKGDEELRSGDARTKEEVLEAQSPLDDTILRYLFVHAAQETESRAAVAQIGSFIVIDSIAFMRRVYGTRRAHTHGAHTHTQKVAECENET